MSTYLYLTCEAHNPPLRAKEESGQHLYDLPRIRDEIKNRKETARIEDEGLLCWNPFIQASARFLSQHQECGIGIVDEYGQGHSIVEEDANNPHGVKVGQVWQDNDGRGPRRVGRIVSIDDTHARVEWGVNTTRVKLTRFKPTSTGYRLIQDVKA